MKEQTPLKKKQAAVRHNLLNLPESFTHSLYTDIMLYIVDEETHAKRLEIASHRLILYSASRHFRKLLTFEGGGGGGGARHESIVLYLNFSSGLCESVVRLFFRLFYVGDFDSRHLTTPELDLIKENVLHLYQLAHYFGFDSLALYCEAYLFDTMCVEYFNLLSNYCLQKNQETGKFYIVGERLTVYARLLQWYQCCIEHVGYAPLQVCGSSEGETHITRKYFSCNKEEIMRELAESVENISACAVPQRALRLLGGQGSQVDYYRRICHTCLHGGARMRRNYSGLYCINLGCLEKRYREGHARYAFRLRRTTQSASCVLEASLEHRSAPSEETSHRDKRARLESEEEEEMLVEGGGGQEEPVSAPGGRTLYCCRTDVTLLSRRYELTLVSQSHRKKSFAHYTELARFEMHDKKYCYTGKCDTCAERKPVYIILLQTLLEKEEGEGLPEAEVAAGGEMLICT